MCFANLVFYFVVLATASTLYRAGQRDIETTRQAAEALRPLAGDAAHLLFSVGLVGSGLLAIPVLAGSASFAIAELFDWRGRVWICVFDKLAASTRSSAWPFRLDSSWISLVNPIRMLFLSALVNGLVAAPLLVLVMLAANNRKIMGNQTNGFWLNLLGWTTVAVMGAAALAFLAGSGG